MGSGIINWSAFDWISFSTLMAGVMAVGAALRIGRMQQNILSRQIQLEESKLRADLFDKRMETYEVIKDFLLNFRMDPVGNLDDKAQILRVSLKIRESQFLFSNPAIFSALTSYWETVHDTRAARDRLEAGAHTTPAEVQAAQEKFLAYPKWAEETARSLPDLFRNDLTIIAPAPSKGRRVSPRPSSSA